MEKAIYQTFLLAILTGVFVLSVYPVKADESSESEAELNEEQEVIISDPQEATEFSLPGEAVPESGIGGGVRGDGQFSLPDSATPNNSLGGGIEGDEIEFNLSGDDIEFTLPGDDSEFALPGDDSEFVSPEESTGDTTELSPIEQIPKTDREAENSSEE